jgi:hypothetical protein
MSLWALVIGWSNQIYTVQGTQANQSLGVQAGKNSQQSRPQLTTIGATVSHVIFLSGNLDDWSNCESGMISFPNGKTLEGQAAQGLYDITVREEFAKLNELTGSITLSSGVQACVSDKSLVDSLEGTVVWENDSMACPKMIVQLYKGLMKIYTIQMNIYEGSTAVVEHNDKDQAAGLEFDESFMHCRHQAYKAHIKSIAVFVHNGDRVEVAKAV